MIDMMGNFPSRSIRGKDAQPEVLGDVQRFLLAGDRLPFVG